MLWKKIFEIKFECRCFFLLYHISEELLCYCCWILPNVLIDVGRYYFLFIDLFLIRLFQGLLNLKSLAKYSRHLLKFLNIKIIFGIVFIRTLKIKEHKMWYRLKCIKPIVCMYAKGCCFFIIIFLYLLKPFRENLKKIVLLILK